MANYLWTWTQFELSEQLGLTGPESFNQHVMVSHHKVLRAKQRKKPTHRILRFLIPEKSTLVILVMLFLFKSLQRETQIESLKTTESDYHKEIRVEVGSSR